jgi:hypothetical protein
VANSVSAYGQTFLPELMHQAAAAVGIARPTVRFPDPRYQVRITQILASSFEEAVVAAGTDFKDIAA